MAGRRRDQLQSFVGGRSPYGFGVIAGHRYLSKEVLDKSMGNTILVLNDWLDVASAIRSHGFPVRLITQSDP